ncbi:nuclear factor kappa-B-binding-like protein [Tanacetum coccineum]|uniref:Nuclear factor kappa-B-binding-like protein n=1 Tax=Tanacetum coccineum TaxID=301880 RepID=A0ABQ5IRW7_9ASTR
MYVLSKTQSTLIHIPLSRNPSDQYHEAVNEATSPDTWGSSSQSACEAFAYTALDGKKSTVAPIRKGPGTLFSKVREHFMIKQGRPSNVSILCLVRDAAVRLPGSIGMQTNVYTLIRDSQYIVEDVSDAHLSDIIEEVDFEDDGMLSTKRWKRQKNESDINLVPDMKELPEFCDGKQHMKIDVVASNMCGKDRVNQVSSLARQPMRKLLS